MMTKEDVLIKCKVTNPNGSGHLLEDTPNGQMSSIKSAMEEYAQLYAKQQAIAFSILLSDNECFRLYGTDAWECGSDKKQYSIEQLYNQFIEQQNEEQ